MSYNDEHKYDDIIHMPHPVSKRHPQMSLLDRAAQFSPFAALTGHEEAIAETARLTDKRMELDENMLEILNAKLQFLKEKETEKPVVVISYFEPDKKKPGGSYIKAAGTIRKIDVYKHRIFMDDGRSIPIQDVIAIDGDIFV
ncbi:MAG: hypothetical protein J6A75_05235 [Lachnospiraceae bacterium]|nr:hypothetical protein [Lachnospiraceae bacterium]